MKNFWNYFIWFVITMFVVSGGAELMNKPDTLAAVLGLLSIVSWTYITIQTELLTTVQFRNFFKQFFKHKKNEENF